MVEAGLDKLEKHMAEKQIKAAPKYVVRSAAEILKMNPEPPVEIWGGITLTNDVFQIIGASGIGKSRVLLDLALTQVLANTHEGKPTFAGLPVHQGPLKWLLLGTENGLYRYHSDLRKMTQFCNEKQLNVLDERLFMTTLEGDGDSYMAVDNEENVAKLTATIAAVKPDILVFDPWGDICGGSELDDKVIRDTIAVIRRLRRGIKDTMPIIIVNHSRMGALENMKATGLDAGNFGKNSKALYTISRAVWNLYYATNDPTDGKVGLYNAKRSNGKPYDERCVQLDPEQMIYKFVEDYDPKAARAEMIAAVSSPHQNNSDVRSANFEGQVEKSVAAVLEATKEGPITKGRLDIIARRAGIPKNDIKSVETELIESHGFETERDVGENPKTYWGTAEQLAPLRAKKQELRQRRESEVEAEKKAKRESREAERLAREESREAARLAKRKARDAAKAAAKAAKAAEEAAAKAAAKV